MQVRILGPDAEALTAADLRRLFPGPAMNAARLERLNGWSRVIAACGARVVGLATYQRIDSDLRVPDFAIDTECTCRPADILHAIVDALELACLAAGCHHLVMTPPGASAQAVLNARGYATINEGCGGSWVEKRF
jgi:hypothetical protein